MSNEGIFQPTSIWKENSNQ